MSSPENKAFPPELGRKSLVFRTRSWAFYTAGPACGMLNLHAVMPKQFLRSDNYL